MRPEIVIQKNPQKNNTFTRLWNEKQISSFVSRLAPKKHRNRDERELKKQKQTCTIVALSAPEPPVGIKEQTPIFGVYGRQPNTEVF